MGAVTNILCEITGENESFVKNLLRRSKAVEIKKENGILVYDNISAKHIRIYKTVRLCETVVYNVFHFGQSLDGISTSDKSYFLEKLEQYRGKRIRLSYKHSGELHGWYPISPECLKKVFLRENIEQIIRSLKDYSDDTFSFSNVYGTMVFEAEIVDREKFEISKTMFHMNKNPLFPENTIFAYEANTNSYEFAKLFAENKIGVTYEIY